MNAIVYRTYGSPDVLKYDDIEKPLPGDDQVLIKVRAASINPLDYHLMKGGPYLLRLLFGLLGPRIKRPGRDVAGQVEAVGRNVTQFKPGDAVFGICHGALAEYACASESALVIKPKEVTFEQAASLPIAALTALQALRDKGKTQAGRKVLINGAAGGVGTYAVQIAKWLGAEVTGVCSSRNVEMVRSLGADRVIDYTLQDFTSSGQRYDVIFDLVANHSFAQCRRVLSPKGIFIAAGIVGLGGSLSALLSFSLTALLFSLFVSQKFIMFVAKLSKQDLSTMAELIGSGKVTPVIDKRYRLSESAEAIRYLQEGHARGKVIIILEG